jgi:molybdenum cofactor cytidylyltransferase
MRAVDATAPGAAGVVICLCDQPDLTAGHIRRLMEAHAQTGRSIAASVRNRRRLPPVLFTKAHFPALRTLKGDTGARALLAGRPEDIADVPAEDLADLDTPLDYAAFLARSTR